MIYYEKNYLTETFTFTLKKNDFEKTLENINYLNIKFEIGLEKDPGIKIILKKLKNFAREYKINNLNKKLNNLIRRGSGNNLSFNSRNNFRNKKNGKNKQNLLDDMSIHGRKISDSEYINLKAYDCKDSFKNIKNDFKLSDFSNNSAKLRNSKNNRIVLIYLNTCNILNTILGPFKVIFVNKKHLMHFLKFLPLFITVSVIYNGQLFNVEKIIDNVYLGTIIVFSSELIGEILSGFILQNMERKKILSVGFFICGIFYFVAIFVNIPIIKISLLFINSILITLLFIVVYVFSAETFETEIKNSLGSLLTNSSTISFVIFQLLINVFPNIFIVFSIFWILIGCNFKILFNIGYFKIIFCFSYCFFYST